MCWYIDQLLFYSGSSRAITALELARNRSRQLLVRRLHQRYCRDQVRATRPDPSARQVRPPIAEPRRPNQQRRRRNFDGQGPRWNDFHFYFVLAELQRHEPDERPDSPDLVLQHPAGKQRRRCSGVNIIKLFSFVTDDEAE